MLWFDLIFEKTGLEQNEVTDVKGSLWVKKLEFWIWFFSTLLVFININLSLMCYGRFPIMNELKLRKLSKWHYGSCWFFSKSIKVTFLCPHCLTPRFNQGERSDPIRDTSRSSPDGKERSGRTCLNNWCIGATNKNRWSHKFGLVCAKMSGVRARRHVWRQGF